MIGKTYLALRLLSLGLLAVFTGGCAMAIGSHEMLPPAQFISASLGTTSQVDLYRQGEAPKRPVIRIALVAAHGNGYATTETLEETLRNEAAKIGAECVIVTQREITRDETIAAYGGGLMLGDQIHRPHMYGVACRYAKVALGVHLSKEGVIEYVRASSTAQKIGMKEGIKLLAVSGKFLRGDDYLIEREVLSRQPGDKIVIEYLDTDGQKVSKDVVLEPMTD